MRIGVNAYSYARVKSDNFTVSDIIDHAKRTGFDGIEFRWADIYDGGDPIESAKRTGEKCREAGLSVFSLNAGVNFLDKDRNAQTGAGKKFIDCAYILGADALRLDTIKGSLSQAGKKGIRQLIETASDGMRELADYAGEKGMKLMVENHGQVMQDSLIVEELINKVGRENYGALVDIGNFLCADEDLVKAVGRMARYAMHVHVKDFFVKSGNEVFLPSFGWFGTRGGNYLRGTILGHGNVPLYQCIRILREKGYDGAISLEFEGIESSLRAIEEGYHVMKKAVGMTAQCNG